MKSAEPVKNRIRSSRRAAETCPRERTKPSLPPRRSTDCASSSSWSRSSPSHSRRSTAPSASASSAALADPAPAAAWSRRAPPARSPRGTVPDGTCFANVTASGGGGASSPAAAGSSAAVGGAGATIGATFARGARAELRRHRRCAAPAPTAGSARPRPAVPATATAGTRGTIGNDPPAVAAAAARPRSRFGGTKVVVAGGGGGGGGAAHQQHPVGRRRAAAASPASAPARSRPAATASNGVDSPDTITVGGGQGGQAAAGGTGGTNSGNAARNGVAGTGIGTGNGGNGGPDADYDTGGGGGGGYTGGGGGAVDGDDQSVDRRCRWWRRLQLRAAARPSTSGAPVADARSPARAGTASPAGSGRRRDRFDHDRLDPLHLRPRATKTVSSPDRQRRQQGHLDRHGEEQRSVPR